MSAEATLILADAPATPAKRGSIARGMRRHIIGVLSAAVIVALVVVALFAPVIAPHSPTAQEGAPIENPSADHWLGTDRLGRDVLSRTIHGARVSLGVAVVAVVIGTVLGVAAGLASGYAGGTSDRINQLLLEIGLAFPGIVALLAIVAAIGPSLRVATLAIAVTSVPAVMRVVRGSVIKEKESLYVEAAQSLGATDLRIVLRHILPNIGAVIIVLASAGVPIAVLTEASLSFLGFGARPPTASWGGDLSGDARTYFEFQPWMAIAPGAAISITVLAFNLLGDTLRDVLDPRMRGTRG